MLTQENVGLVLPSRHAMREVAAAWEAFMAGETRGLEHVRPVIRESWRRSHRAGVDPYQGRVPLVLSAEDIEADQERADLVATATPFFETLIRTWEDERFLVVVSDRHGQLLHTSGHPTVLESAGAINVVPGGGVAEAQIGTAGTNVVLAQGRADYVLWSEHYCQTFHAWAAIGAPVRHPLTHEIIGVVGAAGEELVHPRALDIIQRIAGRLEQLLHHEELLRRVALLDAYHRFLLEHPQDLVAAVDGRGHICGASPSMMELLGAPRQLLDVSLLRLPGVRVEGFHPLTRQQDPRPYGLVIASDRADGDRQATAIPVNGGRQLAGTLVVVSGTQAARSLRPVPSHPWRTRYTFDDLLGETPRFRACLTQARQAVRSDFPVLLLGESGTGKELLAQAIHAASPRARGPFVPVNCGASSDELLAAELFGYVEGAFTGAVKGGRKGKLELAHGGALFLDEVEAMSPKMQVSLLRVLEEGRVTRVGGEQPIAIDVRIIAAANEDIAAAVREKRFRLDLYHRLATFPIALPPLRERADDLPVLTRSLLDRLGLAHLRLTDEALEILRGYTWPGNIRELKNVLVRATAAVQGMLVRGADLPPEIGEAAAEYACPATGSLRETERAMIVRALDEAQGKITQAAACLGIHRATLYRKLKKYGLPTDEACAA